MDISIASGYGSFAARGSTRVALTLAAATRTAAPCHQLTTVPQKKFPGQRLRSQASRITGKPHVTSLLGGIRKAGPRRNHPCQGLYPRFRGMDLSPRASIAPPESPPAAATSASTLEEIPLQSKHALLDRFFYSGYGASMLEKIEESVDEPRRCTWWVRTSTNRYTTR